MTKQRKRDAKPRGKETDKEGKGDAPRTRTADRNRVVYEEQHVQFGLLLREYMTRAGFDTVNAFAVKLKALTPPSLETPKVDATLVSKVLSGFIAIPEHAITGKRKKELGGTRPSVRWSKVLKLTGVEAEAFEMKAWVSRSPPAVYRLVCSLRGEAERLGQELKKLRGG